MPVPDFQSFMLPLLELARDGQVHRVAEAIASLAGSLKVSPEDLAQRLPSGTQTTFANRVNWACTHLKQARLLESCGRGQFRITDRGKGVLGEGLDRVDMRLLSRFSEFQEFRQRTRQTAIHGNTDEGNDDSSTPQEKIEAAFTELSRTLAEEVLASVKCCSPEFFEGLVVDLLVRMGYGGSVRDAGQAVGRSGD